MDFNVKKLASDAGVFFTRAVQVQQRRAAGDGAPSPVIGAPGPAGREAGCVEPGWYRLVPVLLVSAVLPGCCCSEEQQL